MDFAFMLYAAETEGDIPTRRGKIQKAIKLLAQSGNPNSLATQENIFSLVGLNSDSLSDSEISYMESEIERLIRNR